MAITVASFTKGNASSAGSSLVVNPSNALTWVLNRWYVIDVLGEQAAPTSPTPTMTGCTQIATQISGSSVQRQTTFCFLGDGSTSAKTIDFGGSSQTRIVYVISEWQGVDTSSGANGITSAVRAANITTTTGSSTTIGVTLPNAFLDATNNVTFLSGEDQGWETQTPKAGFTKIIEDTSSWHTTQIYLVGQDLSPNMTSASSDNWIGIGFEIVAAAGGGVMVGQVVDVKRPPRLRGPLGLQRGTPFRFDTSRPSGGLITGNSSTTMTFGMSADASALVQGASSSALAFRMTADGTVPAAAAVTSAPYRMMIPMRPTAGGLVITRPVQFSTTQPPARVGDSSTAIAFGSTAAGVVTVTGTTSAAMLFGMTAAGSVLVQGASSQPIPFGTLTDVPAFIGTDIPNIRRRRR